MSGIYFDAGINVKQLQADITKINAEVGRISKRVQEEGRAIDAVTGRLKTGFAAVFSATMATKFIRDMTRVRGEFQQLEIALETILKNKDLADKLLAQVVDFAAKTPFSVEQVSQASKQILAFGFESEKVIPIIKSLGDVSAGLNIPLETLIATYGRVRVQTRMTTRELMTLQRAGVPIVEELSRVLNKSEKDIMTMVSSSRIGFEDVERAFVSMTTAGGKFADLMEKQATTIQGLQNELGDAWTKMLNDVGQSQEGIIATSLKTATSLIDNYEEILKVLKLLVVAYGSYKAAVIAAATINQVKNLGEQIKMWSQLAKMINTARDRQAAFNLVASSNVWALAASAIATVVAALVLFSKKAKTATDIIQGLNETTEKIGRQKEIDGLIIRFDELADKTKKTQAEQDEFNKLIKELSVIFPGAVDGMDKFGKAVDLNREKLMKYSQTARDVLGEKVETDISETERKIIDTEKLLVPLYELRDKGAPIFEQTGKYIIGYEKLSDKALSKTNDKILEHTQTLDDLRTKLQEFRTESLTLGEVNAAVALKPYEDLFGQVSEYSEKQALKIKTSLTELLTAGLGTDAERKIKAEIDKINKLLAIPTTAEQIKATAEALKLAESELAKLRAPGARVADGAIEDKEQEINDLKNKLKTLTGIDKEAAEKRLQQQREAQEKILQAQADFALKQIEADRNLEAARIATMQEGARRRLDEVDLNLRMELDRIKQQESEFKKLFAEAQPGVDVPAEETDRFAQMRIYAEEKARQERERINKESAEEIERIWETVNEAFLTDTELTLKRIEDYYKDLEEQARRAGETDMTEINRARNKEIEEAEIESGFRRLQFEEQLETQRAEIAEQGFNRELRLEKRKLEIVKEYAQKKIKLLQASGKTQNKEEVEQLKQLIAATDKGLKEISDKTLTNVLDNITQITREMKAFSDKVFGANSMVGDMADSFTKLSSLAANVASQNWFGAAADVLGIVSDAFESSESSAKKLKEHEAEIREQAQRVNDLYQERLQLMAALGLISPLDAEIKSIDILERKYSIAANELSKYTQSFVKDGKTVTTTFKDMMDEVYGRNWGAKELSEASKRLGKFVNDYLKMVGGQIGGRPGTGSFFFEKDVEQLNKDINELYKLASEIEQVYGEIHQRATATTSDSIADSIIEGFRKGYRTMEDFTADFEDMMKNAVLNALKLQIMDEPIKEWYKSFADAMDDGLDEDEIGNLRTAFQRDIVEYGRNELAKLEQATGLNFSTAEFAQKGLTGAIKGITEETAGLIAGQFTAMRVNGQEQLATARLQLEQVNFANGHLYTIAENTAYNKNLVDIKKDINEMVLYLKNAI